MMRVVPVQDVGDPSIDGNRPAIRPGRHVAERQRVEKLGRRRRELRQEILRETTLVSLDRRT
jgi:hypothetical protein